MEDWDGIRTALAVARAGTVSGAASALGVHHATVIRHIDALEDKLGAKLFQRHPRGYTLTEAGRMLEEAGLAADARFAQLAAQISGAAERIEGELTITSVPGLVRRVMPALTKLMEVHPGLRLRYVTDTRLFRLETGEAHVAIRAGARPESPDYIVQSFGMVDSRLYASPAYVQRHGAATSLADHLFVLPSDEGRNAPFMRWLAAELPEPQCALISNDILTLRAGVREGLGVGFMAVDEAEGLIEIMTRDDWKSPLWLVTHVDLHRTPKIQSVLAALKGEGQEN
ncbi:LysR family transcriptional regulator [Paracoccus sp. M683]|uniref:LysR family transcriptional regulator n=1 Tax=Paracoccus sp. M683 TaxID=2594268 RepID=UPI00117DE53B|nr:LysR family transcriptional regulator [Paracoccus sp. M683]TRW97562.1 LysR family transcriptional regulator [Paracoccus sp. M683]